MPKYQLQQSQLTVVTASHPAVVSDLFHICEVIFVTSTHSFLLMYLVAHCLKKSPILLDSGVKNVDDPHTFWPHRAFTL